MEISVFLYDADGNDKKIGLDEVDFENLDDHRMLWINISRRSEEALESVTNALSLKNVPLRSVLNDAERPKLEKFEGFYRLFIISVKTENERHLDKVPIDFLVGKNFVVSVHEGEVDYFNEFMERKKGETQIGRLDSESFVASLLDLHIVTYFRVLERIEKQVDSLDERILIEDMDENEFLRDMVNLRSDVSKLRRWFLPHRDVFYALSRPDFLFDSLSGSTEDFQALNQHFENAVNTMDSSRDSVFGLFDLYTTHASHKMNNAMRRLTFVTLVVGASSVIAGTLGMNFKEDFFDSPNGFWIAIGGMILIGIILTAVASYRRWI